MFKANKNEGWTPDKNRHTSDTFFEAVKKILNVLKLSKLNNHIQILIWMEDRQLKNYPKRRDIIIINADKRGVVFTVDTNNFTSKKLSVN